MEAIFSWVGAALGALFVAAVTVAWWEHLVRTSRPPTPTERAVPRAVSVDVQLDTPLPAGPAVSAAGPAPSPANDATMRRAALDGAMRRMASARVDGSAWTETSPMVLQSPPPEPAPASAAAIEPAQNPARG